MSNVQAVERAEKARIDAMNKVAEEKQKTNMAKKNFKEEIAKITKKANVKVSDLKRQLQFWQVVSIGALIIGIFIGLLM